MKKGKATHGTHSQGENPFLLTYVQYPVIILKKLVLYLASSLIKEELVRHLFLHQSNPSESPHQNCYLNFVYQHNENQMRHEVTFSIAKIKVSTLMSKT